MSKGKMKMLHLIHIFSQETDDELPLHLGRQRDGEVMALSAVMY